MQFARLAAAAAIAVTCVTFVSKDTRAGAVQSTAVCSTNTDGSGGCVGEFSGFRDSNDPNAFATFLTSVDQTGSTFQMFTAELNGNFGCTVSSQYPQVAALWPLVISTRSGFSIGWDAAGNCSSLDVLNSSQSLP
jgi:hypothetical protein